VSNPTNPFSWQMPTPTDLVTDLPADFEVFGQAVATSLADLLGGTTDQVLAKNSNTDMDFKWVTSDDANAIQNTIVDAKGDLIGATAADTPARLAVGSNFAFLQADSSTATGLLWNNATWTTYTPTFTAETGTFTTVTTNAAKYTRIGKFCAVYLNFTITTVGTANGTIFATLPFNSSGNTGAGVGRETNVAGFGFYGAIFDSSLQIRKFDNTSPITSGAALPGTYVYEVA
jgi:hypothetical protein